MEYSTVKLIFDEEKCEVIFEDLPHERESGEGTISSTGIYHYPRKIFRETAVETLKEHMLKVYQDEIDFLKKRMELIKACIARA